MSWNTENNVSFVEQKSNEEGIFQLLLGEKNWVILQAAALGYQDYKSLGTELYKFHL